MSKRLDKRRKIEVFAQDAMIYYLHKNRNFIEKIDRQIEEDKEFEKRADFMDKVLASRDVNPNWPNDVSSGLFNSNKAADDYYRGQPMSAIGSSDVSQAGPADSAKQTPSRKHVNIITNRSPTQDTTRDITTAVGQPSVEHPFGTPTHEQTSITDQTPRGNVRDRQLSKVQSHGLLDIKPLAKRRGPSPIVEPHATLEAALDARLRPPGMHASPSLATLPAPLTINPRSHASKSAVGDIIDSVLAAGYPGLRNQQIYSNLVLSKQAELMSAKAQSIPQNSSLHCSPKHQDSGKESTTKRAYYNFNLMQNRLANEKK
jgi:hypothetical protein